VSQIQKIAANVGFPISIEELNAPVATLLAGPLAAHMAGQAVEFAVEAGSRVWSEALELSPDVVALDRAAIVAGSGCGIGA
jgi:hypothetical protein